MRKLRLKTKEYFDSLSHKWDDICTHDINKIKKIIELSGIIKDDFILDIGTGTGILIPYIHSIIGDSGKITAVDISSDMLKIAKEKYNYTNIDYIEGDIHNISLKLDYYDCIFCYSVFPHFHDKQRAVLNMSSFLKKNGKIVICHSQSRKDINKLHKNASKIVKNDILPEMNEIKQYLLNSKIKPCLQIDNEDMFVIISEK